MTGIEFAAVVSWIEDRWGPEKVWAMPDRVMEDFRHLSAGAAMDALWGYYREGNARSPKPGQLLALAEIQSRRRVAAGVDVAAVAVCEPHVFAHWPDESVVVCARCGVEEPHAPHRAGTSCARVYSQPAYDLGESRQRSLDDPDPL